MSVVVFIKGMIDAGFSHEEALRAAEVYEATTASQPKKRTPGAERTARWRERHAASQTSRASQNVTCDESDVCDGGDAPLPLPPSP
ncbi:hypothetical protein ACFPIF_10315, partial [Brevundimonas faecalis]|uniref:hypothetical protein n=1 Tax=Brevundimonas faecalis TaxID=947378 RepID=UPI00361D55DF